MISRNKRAVLIMVLVVGIAGLSQTPLMARTRHVAWDALVVALATVSKQSPLTITDTYQSQLEQLRVENIRLTAELKEYVMLQRQLGTPAFADFKTIPAAVVGRPLDTFASEFVISKGAQDGVTLGAPVVINGSTLFGFITQLHEKSAVGQLLFHPSVALTAQIVSDAEIKIQGLVHGDHYTAVTLSRVPRDQQLAEGQPVITLAKPIQIPFGLLIGHVGVIRDEQNAAYQQTTLRVPYDPDEISAVGVLTVP